jgi:hypothetical protein
MCLVELSAQGKFVAPTSFFVALARSSRCRNSSEWMNARARKFVHPDCEIEIS